MNQTFFFSIYELNYLKRIVRLSSLTYRVESKEYKLHVNALMKDVSKIMLSYIDKSEVPTHVG